MDPFDLFDFIPGDKFESMLRLWLAHVEANATIPLDEKAAKLGGEVEEVGTDSLYAVFDQRDITDRAKVKWYNPKTEWGDRSGSRRRTLKKGLCFHHTAVEGGFGPHKKIIERYMAADIDMTRFTTFSKSPLFAKKEWARAMALAHRFRGDPGGKYNGGVPYHAIMGANSVLYLNLPFDWVTWHGNGSNADFLGVAWDALSSKENVPAADLIQDGRHLIELARREGHPISELTVHAVYTNKPLDPGAEFIEKVMVPLAEEMDCHISLDFRGKKGAKTIAEILKEARPG